MGPMERNGKTWILLACLIGAAMAQAQPPQSQTPKPQMAEDVFKNIQVMKGLPVDEFLGTMGVFSAALGWSCEDCHKADDTNWANFAVDNPSKIRARQMVQMMAGINKTYFQGRQGVTCFSCHRGANHPKVTPNLATLYYNNNAMVENPDDIVQAAPGQPSAEQILDKFITAIGGAQKWAGVNSYAAKGTNSGYGPESGKRQVELYAKAPGARTIVVHTDNGDATTTVDGANAWYSAPLRPVPVLTYSANELSGMKFDAAMAFPGRIKQLLTSWKVGFPAPIGDKDYAVVQGTSSTGTLVTLYFDQDTGLLFRSVRYVNSLVGRFPTMTDYSDYREVAGTGVKMPYHWIYSWLDGRETYDLTDLQMNAPIDALKFAKPAPAKQK